MCSPPSKWPGWGRRHRRPARAWSLSQDDRRMLDLLQADGRTGFAELATATGRSPTTVRRRVAQLRASGALYFDVDLEGTVALSRCT